MPIDPDRRGHEQPLRVARESNRLGARRRRAEHAAQVDQAQAGREHRQPQAPDAIGRIRTLVLAG